jgi:hypothetical protein
MLRALLFSAFLAAATAPAAAAVHSVGNVSFDVPAGFKYTAANDGGAMVLKDGTNFWILAVYSAMPSTGDPDKDFEAAWQRIVMAGPDYKSFPMKPYYNISGTVGYGGKSSALSSDDGQTCTRLFALEKGGVVIPVIEVARDNVTLNDKDYVANYLLGSVRLAPAHAVPVKYSVSMADLAGDWKSGLATSISYYNSSTGQFTGSTQSFYSAFYHISSSGAFTSQAAGMLDSRAFKEADAGRVVIDGPFVTFRGHEHTSKYRFLSVQHGIDGATIVQLVPPEDLSRIAVTSASMYLTKRP